MLKKVKTSLLEIAYEERGDAGGTPVILMHGFPDDAQTWNAVSDALVEKGYRAFAPFTRGYGETRFLNKGVKLKIRNKFRVRLLTLAAAVLFLPLIVAAQDGDEDYISPVRPTVSESASIQKKGVLQVEYGADFDFNAPDFRNRQTAPSGIYFAVNKRLRLDFEFETAASRENRMRMRETGIGDVNLGFKAIARDKPKERLAVAFSYSIKLPAASEEKDLGTGRIDHNLRAIFNRTYGKNDFVVNFSYLNVGRGGGSDRRDSGAQVVFTYERELPKRFGIIIETSGNTVDEQQPRGIYTLGALTYKINKRLRFDLGARPGFGRAAPNFNLFFGLSVGVADLYRKR